MTAVTRLSLTDFRNYRDARLDAANGFVLLSGPNGAGKTNILEAVSLLTPGRGLRQIPISQLARSDGPGGFSVAAWLSDQTEIGTGTTEVAPERRQVRINGAPAAVNSLGERLAVLWLTPAMDRLFTESAGGRRRFLDRLTLALEPGMLTTRPATRRRCDRATNCSATRARRTAHGSRRLRRKWPSTVWR